MGWNVYFGFVTVCLAMVSAQYFVAAPGAAYQYGAAYYPAANGYPYSGYPYGAYSTFPASFAKK